MNKILPLLVSFFGATLIHAGTVGGTITGLKGSLTLVNNGTNPLVKKLDGKFVFSKPVP